MKKIKLSILIVGLLISTDSFAQNRPEESLSLINNAGIQNDLYNGNINVNIPLFKIPIGNLVLSNEISNSSIGFRPRMDESIFGLHWYVNQFGSITRVANKDFLLTKYATIQAANGVAGIYTSDEIKVRETTDCVIQRQDFNYGFVASKKQILQNPNSSGITSGFTPDKFYFDFFGYKGYFVFDNIGEPLVFCENAKLKVVGSSSLASKCYSVKNPIDFQNKNISEIKIMDDKGNTFYFGGSYDAVETNYSEFIFEGSFYNPTLQSNQSFYSGTRANYIQSWFLKKVELGTGEIIEANYKAGDSNTFNSFLQNTLVNNNTLFPTEYPTSAQLQAANLEVSFSNEIDLVALLYNGHYNSITNITKRAILNNIKVLGKNIEIDYSYFKDNKGLLHLNNVNLQYFGKSENIIFNQIPLGGTNYRYFLTSLNNNGKIYSFEYDKTDNLPQKTSYGTNDFGYWNGSNTKGVGNSNNFYNATLLKKIIYPTKGYTIFNREKADVSKKLFGGIIDYTLGGSDAVIGRIVNKIDFDGEKEYKTNYSYKLSDGKSSGILDPKVISGKIVDQQIKYSQVQEEILNKGKSEYFFNDIVSNPDDFSIKKFGGPSTNYLYFKDDDNREYQRGKLITKNIYDSNNKLIRKYQYEYNNFLKPETELADLGLNDCSTCKVSDQNYYVLTSIDRSSSQNLAATRYVPVIPYLQSKEKITEYLNDKEISTETTIKYRESNISWHPYPEQIETTTTKGTTIKKYLYPHDLRANSGGCTRCTANNNIVGGQYPSYISMVNSNIMYPLIEITKNEFNKYFLQENLFYTSPFVPQKIRNSKLDAAVDFTNYTIPVEKTVEKINYDLIDDKANNIQSTDKSGIPTVTLYGYKQSLPIVKITGITYTQLMQILGQSINPTDYLNLDIINKSNQDVDAASELVLINALESFKNNPLLKDYPITTYTYDPLIGVTSITPPSGIREVYIYDSANRLKEIRENSQTGNILKEFKYNYKN